VYTSHEIKHQIIDSEAKAIICEDILYDNVLESGIELKNVILSNISEYLPFLARNVAKKAIMKAYQGLRIPTAQYVKEKGLYLFSDLIKNSPPDHHVVKINPKEDLAALLIREVQRGCPRRPC